MAETYEQWKAKFADSASPAAKDERLMRDTYAWHVQHPKGDDLQYFLTAAEKKYPTGDYSFGESVRNALSPPRRGSGSAATATPTSQPAGATATSPSKADAASAINNLSGGDPALAAILQQALQGGTTAGSVMLWPSLGVDPNATVLGTKAGRGPGTNTMNAAGQLQHGADVPTRVGVTQTADEWLKGLYKMSPTELADVQHRLWEQGWYSGTKITDPSMIQYGRPDAATLAAYAEVLGETARYNAAGKQLTIGGVIDMGSPLKGQSAAAQGQPFERTNPADLKAGLTSQAQQSLGRDPTAQEISAFQGQYLGQEDAARRQIIADGIANKTEGVTGPASPSAAAQDYIDTHNLTDKLAYGAVARQAAFYSMLKSPV